MQGISQAFAQLDKISCKPLPACRSTPEAPKAVVFPPGPQRANTLAGMVPAHAVQVPQCGPPEFVSATIFKVLY